MQPDENLKKNIEKTRERVKTADKLDELTGMIQDTIDSMSDTIKASANSRTSRHLSDMVEDLFRMQKEAEDAVAKGKVSTPLDAGPDGKVSAPADCGSDGKGSAPSEGGFNRAEDHPVPGAAGSGTQKSSGAMPDQGGHEAQAAEVERLAELSTTTDE